MLKLPHSLLFATVVLGSAIAPGGPLLAQTPTPPPPNQPEVYLIQQDGSDCSNSDVKVGDWSKQKGTVIVNRGTDGITRVKVAMTASPDTTYHFFLKCVRLLGDIKTEDEGEGAGLFEFPTNSVGEVYGFDMYPEGAPPGNKFQSTQVKFQ
jgi:hypothetical protein